MTTFHSESRPTSRSGLSAWYEAVLEDQERSGLSVAAYAKEIEVTPATLYNWRRRLESRSPRPRREAAGLVRVQVRREAQRSAAGTGALVVHMGQGRSIEVPAGFDGDALARVIEVLEAC